MGLFSLGETMAMELTRGDSRTVIYLFSFAIGFSTTMAEPALSAIARKAKEISDGRINDFVLRIFVAFGVAIGIAMGAFRIVRITSYNVCYTKLLRICCCSLPSSSTPPSVSTNSFSNGAFSKPTSKST